MKTPVKVLIVVALAVAIAGTVALEQDGEAEARLEAPVAEAGNPSAEPVEARQEPLSTTRVESRNSAPLPRLVDLGADKCIPCKMMAPILDDLKNRYADRFTTEFIDVWKNPDEGKTHGVEMIPTQIFYDAQGTELFRHVGFFGKEDILAKWQELGVDTGTAEEGAGGE
ncbi:MAG: thioredoxin family protein [Verrucomicrobiales bacterium]|nr:thioredoxin family protein [Verrucomicrobiales bacterium]MCP5527526.1 thioredoxin family protein [Verrucomicrobiales bacterium]